MATMGMAFLLYASTTMVAASPSQTAVITVRLGQYRRVKFTYLMTDHKLKRSKVGFQNTKSMLGTYEGMFRNNKSVLSWQVLCVPLVQNFVRFHYLARGKMVVIEVVWVLGGAAGMGG